MEETNQDERVGFVVSGSACRYFFGFLSDSSRKGMPLPEECLTCEKMLDCRSSTPSAQAEDSGRESKIEEIVEPSSPILREREKICEQIYTEVESEPNPQKHEIRQFENSGMKDVRSLDDSFRVDSPGSLYDHWTGTVLVSTETVNLWGQGTKKVEIVTQNGQKMTARVYSVPNIQSKIIQLPRKLKAELNIKDGDFVELKPIEGTTPVATSPIKSLQSPFGSNAAQGLASLKDGIRRKVNRFRKKA